MKSPLRPVTCSVDKPNVALHVWRPEDKDRPILVARLVYNPAMHSEDGTWVIVSHVGDLLHQANIQFDPLNLTILCRLIS